MQDESFAASGEAGMRSYPASEDRRTSELRLRIDERRERLTRAAAAIERKLSPQRVLKPLAANLKDVAAGSSSTLIDTVKENPLAVLLSALGLGWLFLRSGGGSSSEGDGASAGAGLGEKVAEKSRSVAEGHREKARKVGEKAGDLTHQVGAEVHHLTLGMKRGGRHARRWMEDSPLLLGAVTLALGFLATLAVPRSGGEEDLLGRLRDRWLGKPGQGKVGQAGRRVEPGHPLGLAPDEEGS